MKKHDGRRRRRRHRHRRSNIFIYTKITASLPFIEVNLNLTPQQISIFINGLKYVMPCQSRFSRKSIDDLITEQYQTISTTVKDCLKDNGLLITNERTSQAFQALEHIMNECKSKKLSKKLNIRAQREHKIVRYIQRVLRQRPDIIIRRTDKSKVFYIGKASDFERKAQEYMLKTEAYQEITNDRCPLADNLRAVQTLLDYFVTQNALTKKQRNQICPKLDKLELGHYHGIPKPHKVNSYQC
jgi:hypothetical protein